MPSSTSDVLLYFLALFVPPLSVFLKRGCAADFWINILLSILGWIPGVIRESDGQWGIQLVADSLTDAWYIISKYERPEIAAAPPGQYA